MTPSPPPRGPSLSVVIPTYAKPGTLEKVIAALEGQDVPLPLGDRGGH